VPQIMFQLAILAAVVAIAVMVEAIKPLEKISWRSRAVGSLFASTLISCSVLLGFGLSRLMAEAGFRPILPPLEAWAGWMAIPVLLLLSDFLAYWQHRFEHRFFWLVHRVHHSPTELHAANNYGHPLFLIPSLLISILPLSFLNFYSLAVPLTVTLIAGVLNSLAHAPVDFHFGPLRRILVDNRFHRIHHSQEPEHFDQNFGALFSIWDQLFGTAYFPRPDEWPKVGVAGLTQPRNLREFLALPFYKAS
jgi:sterol desaturase/sphingolipid hydroxylase (fatty acid hydroxylase superfamily)